ncbi:MAG: NAD(P)H-hydrate dehydratase [Burkholderiales bacterium]|nr:NAD(P)H-hydrate dehydratase [Burkholderiales bacterium]
MTTIPLLPTSAIRAIEVEHARREPGSSLMLRAADAAVRTAVEMCGGSGRILVMAGPGNNGGDAWVVARQLQALWYRVTVLSISAPKAVEAAAAHTAFLEAGGTVVESMPDAAQDLIIDGLLGIGLSRPPESPVSDWIDCANASGWPILALDVPSGLDADTGRVAGRCIKARQTITFIADKPGLHTGEGPDHAGTVEVASLGIDPEVMSGVDPKDRGQLLLRATCPHPLQPRRLDTHKGRFGTTGIIGGARGMAGAGLLAARTALFAGAGKVFLGLLDETLGTVDWNHPEIMFRRPRDMLENEVISALIIGPGLGTTDAARNILESSLKSSIPIVLDADALNLVSRGRALQTALKRRAENGFVSIMTPHPSEAARLLGTQTADIRTDRINAAKALAARFGSVVVLKGVGSVIAEPSGSWSINQSGNPGMAAGGMGDVLAGLLGALLAQSQESGLSAVDVVRLATWVHGRAADELVAGGTGPIGLTPSEVARACRTVLNKHCTLPILR